MITGHFHGLIEQYFAPHPAKQVRALFASTAVLNFAVAAISLFEPLYLHKSVGFSIPQVLLMYGAVYVLYFFLLPLGGRISRRHGYEHTILFSAPFLIAYYLSLFAMQHDQRFVVTAVLSFVLQKILYWPGYHANLAAFGSHAEQGREVSNIHAIAGLAAVLAPAVGGAVIANFGYATLIAGVTALVLLSNVPLLRVPDRYEPQPFAYAGAVARPFARGNRRKSLAFAGYGEELFAMVAWPIFMATVFADTSSLGIVVSLAMLLNVASVLYVGRLNDDGQGSAVLRSGALYEAASWAVRPFLAGGLGVFLIDTFYRVSKNMMGVPLVSRVYDDARSGSAMETIIRFEMCIALGKASAAVIGALVLWLYPGGWKAIFALAAVYASLYALAAQPSKESGTVAMPVMPHPTNEPL